MKKINTSPISGMQELLPDTQLIFNNLKNNIAEVYHKHGFLNIETPTIDRCEILLAKAGGDTEKQIYKVVKTAESSEDADQALRFDHTVPLARYVVEHENDLTFPFKVSQIGRNFRGERPQKGRFREFYQCDVDVIGRGSLPIYYDADVISTLIDTYNHLNLKTTVIARVSNRKIITGALMALGVNDKSEDIYSIIDHAEKVAPEQTEKAFEEIGLSKNETEKILGLINICDKRAGAIEKIEKLGLENDILSEGIDEISQVTKILEDEGLEEFYNIDLKIVRGLDYYTGTVFEFALKGCSGVGSVGGGGRYENLAGYFTEQKLPGVGGSIGLSRLFYVLIENDLLDCQVEKPIEVAIIPISDNEIEYSLKVAKEMREEGKSTVIVPTGRKFGDRMSYAAKIAKSAIVIGENEVKADRYEIKIFKDI